MAADNTQKFQVRQRKSAAPDHSRGKCCLAPRPFPPLHLQRLILPWRGLFIEEGTVAFFSLLFPLSGRFFSPKSLKLPCSAPVDKAARQVALDFFRRVGVLY